jgi:allophanate hydrolase subunit 2
MGLLVHNPGVSATVQDLGRVGYREWGVPPGGAFDRGSAALANALLGNPAECAVLELTLVGGVYEALTPLALALAGAPMAAAIDLPGELSRPLAVPQSFSLASGERLVLGGAPAGARTYLAVRGGWRTHLVLGSRSHEERLKAGILLAAEPGHVPARRPAEALWEPPDASPLGIIAGPDAGLAVGLDHWALGAFGVGQHADRMGLRLEGPSLTVKSPPERISAPVAPGAVQVAGGQAIVLGVACGTMGGYPHVAHVISADLDRLGQLRPGDTVRFRPVSVDEARHRDRAARQARSDRLRWLRELGRSDRGTGVTGGASDGP